MKRFVISLAILAAFSIVAAEPLLASSFPGAKPVETQQQPTVAAEPYLSYQPPVVGTAADFPRFKVNLIPIHWAVPTNQMGKSLWTYKVKPADFPVEPINDLLSQSGFTNRIKTLQELPAESFNDSLRSRGFTNQITGPRQLLLHNSNDTVFVLVRLEPMFSVAYVNHSAEAMAGRLSGADYVLEPVVDWPATNKLEGEGLKLLEKFGITREDLSPNPNGPSQTFGRTVVRNYLNPRVDVKAGIMTVMAGDQTFKFADTEAIPNSFFFIRRLDGIDFHGGDLFSHGCFTEFDKHGRLSCFQLTWRNYQRDKCYFMASREEVIQRILEGKTILSKMDKSLLSLNHSTVSTNVQALTITGIIPVFIDVGQSDLSEFLFPTARVEAIAGLGTNQVGIELYCPILSTNRVNP